jgi:hypothetical protein
MTSELQFNISSTHEGYWEPLGKYISSRSGGPVRSLGCVLARTVRGGEVGNGACEHAPYSGWQRGRVRILHTVWTGRGDGAQNAHPTAHCGAAPGTWCRAHLDAPGRGGHRVTAERHVPRPNRLPVRVTSRKTVATLAYGLRGRFLVFLTVEAARIFLIVFSMDFGSR